MKNIAISLAMTVLLAACSSGSTVAPLPSTVNSQFTGSFVNQNNSQAGTIRLDIAETDAGAVTGNVIIESTGFGRCIANGTVTGVNNGFNLNLMSEQARRRFVVTTTRTRVTGMDDMGNPITATSESVRFSDTRVSPSSSSDGRGNSTDVTVAEEDVTGTINFQFAISNNGNTLSGTYTTSDDLCSNSTGTGEATLNRS